MATSIRDRVFLSAVLVCLAAILPTGAQQAPAPAAGIRYTKYAVTEIGTFGGSTSEAWGINNTAQVVGRAHLAGDVTFHAFLYDAGVMTDLGTIGAGCSPGNSWAFDINDAGDIAGGTCASGIYPRAFRRVGGVMADLGTLGGTHSEARSINDTGDVVGSAAIRGDVSRHAFLYRSNAMQDLGTLGGGWSGAYHVNGAGRVVGYSEISMLPNREPHAFLYTAPTMLDLFPGSQCCSAALGINDADRVVGTVSGAVFGVYHDAAFLYDHGAVTHLGALAYGATTAYGINQYDEVVGASALGAGYFHAFLYANGRMLDLNDLIPDHPAWDLNVATAINDVGQIVGMGTIGGHTRGFRLDPIQTAATAVDDAFVTGYQAPLVVAAPGVLANDYGSGISSMVAGLVTSVSHGTLMLQPDGGFTYTPAAGYAGPDAFTYRALNVIGPSNLATVALTVSPPATAQPPTGLYAASIAGDVVTLRWQPPQAGPRPTSYVLEGGLHPGEVLARVGTGSATPLFTFTAPSGSFYIRMRSLVGVDQSAPSSEIPLHVRAPVVPSAPASLTSVVNGSAVYLAWRNTFGGGAPTGVILEAQTAAGTYFLPLGLTDTFAAPGVPPGDYTLRVWAINASGPSAPSNTVVVRVPSACAGPSQAPSNFLAYAVGRTVSLTWDAPASGPAATGYVVIVGGAFVGAFPVGVRTLSGAVGPGSYNLSVVATNPCGPGPATAVQTVVVP